MKSVLIVGAGGFGRELLAWCSHDPTYGREWEVIGFLDDNPNALKGYRVPCDVVGKIGDHESHPEAELMIAIGRPDVKRRVCQALRERSARFRNFIHPTVVVGERVKLGVGVILCPGVIVTSDISLGDFVMINCGASVGHDVQIGEYSTLSGHCDVTGFCQIGAGVFMGSGARVIPGRKIGDDAIIGAGAVVITHIPAGRTAVAAPARLLLGV